MNENLRAKLDQIVGHRAFVPSIVGISAFAGGLGCGYILGKRKIVVVDTYQDPDFDLDVRSILEQEEINDEDEEVIADDPEEGTVLVVEEEAEEVEEEGSYHEVAARFVEDRIQRTIETRQGTPVEAVDHSIFANSGDEGWDYEAEVRNRTKTEPYILHRDEFFEEEAGYIQLTLTYYEGDDILVDEEDVPIYNYATVVGPLRFGHGSGDPNVFYVRNDKRRAEYEILRHEGLYSREVVGLDIEDNVRVRNLRDRELKHSDYNRKFKLE